MERSPLPYVHIGLPVQPTKAAWWPWPLTVWHWKWCPRHVSWATSAPILVFLGLSVVELGPMYATDRRQIKASLNASAHDMPPPRPASGDTIYVMFAYGKVTITVRPYWPASTTNQSGLVTFLDPWPFDIESGVRVTCDAGYLCANFSLPRPLCSRVRPDVRDRQTSDKSIAQCLRHMGKEA